MGFFSAGDSYCVFTAAASASNVPESTKEIYDTERHLLYVACTRARDHLLVTGVEPASEFLDDLRM
jgi:ATP-dependent exoDNAse (exonuclease V) beta subunit